VLTSNIIGGLGNQMFQYAAGRALALKSGQGLKVDITDFSGYQLHHGFELNRLFNCNAEIASHSDISNILGWQTAKFAQRFLKKPQLKLLRRKSFVVEPHYHYWHGLNEVNGNAYLVGYWQSEKYFADYVNKIREDFTFKLPLSSENSKIADQVLNVNAVSLHVRRGDYVSDSKNSFIGVCSLDYYQKAIAYIKSVVDSPVLYIFSDDIDWVKTNLVLDSPSVFVSHNQGAESYNDMRLMSMCQHHIIANSSFSWWGAWLNAHPEKIVIAPKKWFASDQFDTSDLLPLSWIKI
jgi:hypothetical protein